MKKNFCTFIVVFVVCLLTVSITACAKNSKTDDSETIVESNNYSHTINISSEKLFNYYFTVSETNSFSSNYNFGTGGSSKYGTKSTSTITVTPKLTGFVDYSGYVELKAETEKENKSEKVLKNRKINIEYWGTTIDSYDVNNETNQNDYTISFSDVNYKFNSVNIVITYHHEGLSGNNNLSFETISITKYNYKSYLSVKIENRSYSKTTYKENDTYHRYPIYTYYYYQTYTILPVAVIEGCKEFNNIVLKFDNGVTIELDALGMATYKSPEYSEEKPIPKLSNIEGCIDFYPIATYNYETEI